MWRDRNRDVQVWADREHGDRQIDLQVWAIEGTETGRWAYRYGH